VNRLTEILHNIAEQTADITRTVFPWTSYSNIRYMGGLKYGLRFWPTRHPIAEGSQVNYEKLRAMYRNAGDTGLGNGFSKPIIDLQVSFVGLPVVSTETEETSNFLNECVQTYWADEIQQLLRDATRDSKTIVRMTRPDIMDPLMTIEEAEHCSLELIPPELVDIERNGRNKRIIERAVIHHKMLFVKDEGSIENGRDPVVEEHDVLEFIDRERYSFFDQTTSEWLDEMGSINRYNFVPLLEVFNEWDTTLKGGQSDLETVVPFIQAFHDTLTQGLQAHGYHSTPKITMNLADIAPFIKNNFPEAVDENGEIKAQSEISWQGREIIFLSIGDEISFLEAKSVLGDTRTLLEFLIDCICIASQTPEWAFMRVDSGSANSDRNAQTVPFIKKVERKRTNFIKPVQELCKMALVMSNLIPVRPSITWKIVRVDDEVVFYQAFQQLVMGLEVAAERGEISDETYMRMIKQFLPVMKSSMQESKEAERDLEKRQARMPEIPQQTGQNGNQPPEVDRRSFTRPRT
jgi:hypothetical protein